MTNFGPWEFIFRWLFALPFMGFKPLNSTKIYLAESEHYTIVHNIRMLTDWTRCTNFRFGLLFFFFKTTGMHPPSRLKRERSLRRISYAWLLFIIFFIIFFLLLSSRSSNIIDLRIFACMQLYIHVNWCKLFFVKWVLAYIANHKSHPFFTAVFFSDRKLTKQKWVFVSFLFHFLHRTNLDLWPLDHITWLPKVSYHTTTNIQLK